MQVEAELVAPSARIQLVRYLFAQPPSGRLHVKGVFRIELCLTLRHRTARACFRDHWKAHRFEPIGRVFVVPPDTEVLARSDEDSSLTSIVCELKQESILDLFERSPDAIDQRLLASLDIRDAHVQGLLRRLADEATHPGFASEALIDSITTQLSVELFRHGDAITKDPPLGALSAAQLRLIDERLREVGPPPDLTSLARLCGISVRTITRNFPRSRGCTIGAYVARSQMEHAKDLLVTGASVSSIAQTLGFSTCSNFCYAFRRATGVPPRQFRQTVLGP